MEFAPIVEGYIVLLVCKNCLKESPVSIDVGKSVDDYVRETHPVCGNCHLDLEVVGWRTKKAI